MQVQCQAQVLAGGVQDGLQQQHMSAQLRMVLVFDLTVGYKSGWSVCRYNLNMQPGQALSLQ